MDHIHHNLFSLLLLTIMLSSQVHQSSSWWFSSGKNPHTVSASDEPPDLYLIGAEFALESLHNDENAINLVESAKLQMRASKSCWVNAYGNLFASCSKIVSDQDLKDRLTWDLSDCFQKHSGRLSFPYCNPKYPTKNCLKELDDDAHKVFLQYFLQIDSICHQLQ